MSSESSPLSDVSNESVENSRISFLSQNFNRQDIDGDYRLACKHENCQQTFSIRVSHTVLRNHVRNKHGILDSTCSRFVFHQDHKIGSFLKLIARHRLPYAIVESEEIRRIYQLTRPTKALPCRQTVSDIFKTKADELLKASHAVVSKAERFSLTFDIWSPKYTTASFGCLMAHHISDDFILKASLIEFQEIDFPHDATVISKFIADTMTQANLQGSILALTMDNASNNTSAFELLRHREAFSRTIHIRCFAHVLNLAVKAALKLSTKYVSPVRAVVKAIKCSISRRKQFREVQQGVMAPGNTGESLNLVLDVEHRWNSTYKMLDRAILLREAIDAASATIPALRGLEQINWPAIIELKDYLAKFYSATMLMCGQSYPTISLIRKIVPALTQMPLFVEFTDLDESARECVSKLNQYRMLNNHEELLIAIAMDPRTKMDGFAPEEETRTFARLRELTGIMEENVVEGDEREDEFLKSIFTSTADRDEISRYFGEPLEPRKVDPLAFWLSKKKVFPHLAEVARGYLSIQATSVACEQTFSLSGLVENPRRCKMFKESFRGSVICSILCRDQS